MAERAPRRGRCIFPPKELFTALAIFNPALPPVHRLLTAPPARSHVFLNLNSIWLTVINHAAGSGEVYQTAAEAKATVSGIPACLRRDVSPPCLSLFSLRKQGQAIREPSGTSSSSSFFFAPFIHIGVSLDDYL